MKQFPKYMHGDLVKITSISDFDDMLEGEIWEVMCFDSETNHYILTNDKYHFSLTAPEQDLEPVAER